MSMMCKCICVTTFPGRLHFLLKPFAKEELQIVGDVGSDFGEHFANFTSLSALCMMMFHSILPSSF